MAPFIQFVQEHTMYLYQTSYLETLFNLILARPLPHAASFYCSEVRFNYLPSYMNLTI